MKSRREKKKGKYGFRCGGKDRYRYSVLKNPRTQLSSSFFFFFFFFVLTAEVISQDLARSLHSLTHEVRDLENANRMATARIADLSEQLETLHRVAEAGGRAGELAARLAAETSELRAALDLVRPLVDDQNAEITSLRIALSQKEAEANVASARSHRVAMAAVEAATRQWRAKQEQLQNDLARAAAENTTLADALREAEAAGKRQREQHEEQLAALARRKTAGATSEAALRQRIAVLEESLANRDNATAVAKAKPSPKQNGRSITKKFRIQ